MDETAIVGCIRRGQEEEYRKLIQDFVAWCDFNHLHLNTTKVVVDFRRPSPQLEPVTINGHCVEFVKTYKYLGVQLDDRTDWTANTDALCRRGQSRLYFLRRPASFNICKKLMQMFYQTVVASALFCVAVCWGGSIKKKDASHLDKLVKKVGSILGSELDSLVKRWVEQAPVNHGQSTATVKSSKYSRDVLAPPQEHLLGFYAENAPLDAERAYSSGHGGSPQWVKDLECRRCPPTNVPRDRTPPSPRGTAGMIKPAWSPEGPAPGMPGTPQCLGVAVAPHRP
ncbi:hypothetical protein QTP86_002393 [Hemibagrus guttatus]|nr:hypothetical protein QTP86_002393 [Hemibagrus guttatus]